MPSFHSKHSQAPGDATQVVLDMTSSSLQVTLTDANGSTLTATLSQADMLALRDWFNALQQQQQAQYFQQQFANNG